MSSSHFNNIRFSKRVKWSALNEGVVLAASMLAILSVSRLMGEKTLGELALLLLFIEIVGVFFSLGIPLCLTRYQALEDNSQGAARKLSLPYLLLTIAGLLLVFFWPSPVSTETLMALLISRQLKEYYISFLRGKQDYKRLAFINILGGILLGAGAIYAAYYQRFDWLLWSYVGQNILPAYLGIKLMASARGKYDLKPLFSFAIASWIAASIAIVSCWSRTELFFIKWGRENPHELGYYAAALYVSGLILRGVLILSQAFMPHFANIQDDIKRLQSNYSDGIIVLSFFLFPVVILLAFLCPVLVPLLFGPEFEPAVYSSLALTLMGILQFSSIASALLYGAGKAKFMAWSSLLVVIIFWIFCILFIPRWGLWGAVWARGFSQVLSLCIGLSYLHISLRISTPYGKLIQLFFLALMSGIITWVFITFCSLWISILAVFFFALPLYVFSSIKSESLSPSSRKYLFELLQLSKFERPITPT